MADKEPTSMKAAAIHQAKREGRAWLVALIAIVVYWIIRAIFP